MKVKFATNHAFKGKVKPEELSNPAFYLSFFNTEEDVDGLIRSITDGYLFTSRIIPGASRTTKNFLGGQVLALDLDTEDERSTFDYLSKDEFIARYAAFGYTTPSHTPSAPRCRIVFVLSSEVRDVNIFSYISIALNRMFDDSDSACKDPVRLYFGSEGADTVLFGNTLNPYWFYQKYGVAERERQERERQEVLARLKSGAFYQNGSTPSFIIDKMVQNAVNRVLSAPDGQKAIELNKAGYWLGGLIAAGYDLSIETASSALQAAILSRDIKSPSNAIKIIENSIRDGLSNPQIIPIENKSVIPQAIAASILSNSQ